MFTFDRIHPMQILKDDVRQRILSIARSEFIEHGVKNSSMRNIAQKADVATGNIYKYFRSKDEIFCTILQPLINLLERYIHSHNDELFLNVNVFRVMDLSYQNLKEMIVIIRRFRPELRLLLFDSDGTSFKGYIEHIIEERTQMGTEYMRLMKERYPHINTDISPFVIHFAASVWVKVFCELVQHDELPEEEVERAVNEYARFCMAGWKELMQPFKE